MSDGDGGEVSGRPAGQIRNTKSPIIYSLAILYGAFDFATLVLIGYAFIFSIPIGVAVIWIVRSRLPLAWKPGLIAALFCLFILFLPQIFLFGVAGAPYALADYFAGGMWFARAIVFVVATGIVLIGQAISSRWAEWRGMGPPEP